MNLTLDENHIYRFEGKVVDGLTSTLQEAGLIRSGDEWFMTRGTAVHLATEYYDKMSLDESTVDPQIQGYLDSWKRFRVEQNYTPIEIEYPIFHPELLVASKVDRLPLLDLKTGSHAPWHVLQIGFQWVTLRIDHPSDISWAPKTVYLDPDGGSPKVKVYSTVELREAFKVYCSILHFIRWRRSVGIKNANGNL